MANMFNSKEIYKRIPKVPSSQNPLRIVRGVYVSGTYRPAYYIDAGVQIKSITTTQAVIKDYSNKYENLNPDPTLNIFSIDISGLTFIDYGKAYSVLADNSLNIFSMSLDISSIENYSKAYHIGEDSSLNIFGISISEPVIESYVNTKINTNKDFAVHISSITTNAATVSNS